MAFERARVGAAAMVLAAGSAGAVAAFESPRLLVACVLAGLAAAAYGWAALGRIAHRPVPPPPDPPPAPRPPPPP
ncbi:MAG: hypothetical protein ACT6RP_22495, partial [Roseateles sp.]